MVVFLNCEGGCVRFVVARHHERKTGTFCIIERPEALSGV